MSLRKDLDRRCYEIGVTCRSLSDVNRSVPISCVIKGILFVSPEECVPGKLVEVVNALFASGRLRRIVVDEVHLVLLSESFRAHMSGIFRLRPTLKGGNSVPLVLMSATIPPKYQNDIVASVRMNRPTMKIIRGTLRRHNVAITVELLPDEMHFDDLNRRAVWFLGSSRTRARCSRRSISCCSMATTQCPEPA